MASPGHRGGPRRRGFRITITARRPDTLEETAEALRAKGHEVASTAADMNDEEAILRIEQAHRERFGRLDVLVNNAGVGIGAPAAEHRTKHVDLQLDVNLRALVLTYRECSEMLRETAAETNGALVVNLASMGAKSPQPWLSV